MYDDNHPWRYCVNPDGTVSHGRMYRLDTHSDAWESYWDGGEHVAFYDLGYRGLEVPSWADSDISTRATDVYCLADTYGQDRTEALTRLARRLTGRWDSDFICVGLDRGVDLWVLSWDGDPDGVWRDEIQEIAWGNVYRCEVETYFDYLGPDHSGQWLSSDDMCEEWYGEDKAEAALVKAFGLAEFPAEHFIGEPVGA